MRATLHQAEGLDPVAIGRRSGLLYSKPGETRAGFGPVHVVECSTIGDMGSVVETLSQIETPNGAEVRPFGFVAVPFFEGVPFDVYIPACQVLAGSDGLASAVTIEPLIGDVSLDQELNRLFSTSDSNPANDIVGFEFETSKTQWLETIRQGVERINRSDLRKVVLSWGLTLSSAQPVSVPSMVSCLYERYKGQRVFRISDFVGASPELLIAKRQSAVTAQPLAGTEPNRPGEPNHQEIARLIGSQKYADEHRITIEWFLDRLMEFCSFVDADYKPSAITLPTVHHLGTTVSGQVSSESTTIIDLLDRLHPTPAVGGDPQADAITVIRELEPASRGFYGGPVGWFDGAGDGEFAVGIRSAQVAEREIYLRAGVGLTKDSDSEMELTETVAKFAAIAGLLGIDAQLLQAG